MGKYLNHQGQFQSDKYPDLPPDKVILSFKDPAARTALRVYAAETADKAFAEDIITRIESIEKGDVLKNSN